MASLELSSVEAVAHFLGIDAAGEDYNDLVDALAAGREQITRRVLPADRLPDPLPESLHRACAVRSAEIFADRPERYGYQAPAEEDLGGGPPPARFIVRDLIEAWKRPAAGVGPDNSTPQW